MIMLSVGKLQANTVKYNKFIKSIASYKSQQQINKIVDYAHEVITKDTLTFNSLLKLLDEKSKKDKTNEIKTQRSILYIEHLLNSKRFTEAEQEIVELDKLISTMHNNNILSLAYAAKGDFFNYTNEKTNALDFYNKSLESAKKTNNNILIVATYLKQAIINHDLGEYDKALLLAKQSLKLSNEKKITKYTIQIYSIIGNAYMRQSNLENSLEYHIKALKQAEIEKDSVWISSCYNNIGAVYFNFQDYNKALDNYLKAISFKESDNSNKAKLASSYNNIAIIYRKHKEYEEALNYYHKALELKVQNNDILSSASTHNNIALVYNSMKNFPLAEKHLKEAYTIYEQFDNKSGLASNLINHASIYMNKGDYSKALDFALKAKPVIEEANDKKQALINYGLIVKIYELQGNYKKAYLYFRTYFDYKDSLYNIERSSKISEIQTKYETEKKESENALLRKDKQINELNLVRSKNVRNFLIFILFLALLIVVGSIYLYQKQKSANIIIQSERDKSDKLLLNILPYKVAKQLKEKGKTIPQSFDNVTVLLSDLVNFTQIASELQPETVIEELNDLFTYFDAFIEENNCERIKTIGDAYLAVCGMPEQNEEHAINILNAAQCMIKYLKKRNETHDIKWDIRIGIHTGSVVGGIVGVKKYIYDIFGDTINTTSRIENSSQPMQISISETTYQLVKDEFEFEIVQSVEIKGKGAINIYRVCNSTN